MSGQDINALLGSRICHDLISPLGAISNGIELLELSGINAAPEIALISESVENANTRIRFFRVAFGVASPREMIGAQECRALMQDLSRGSRLQYSWLASEDRPRSEVRLAFLLLLCLESAMPYGGTIEVRCQEGLWQISGETERVKVENELWAMLVNPTSDAEIKADNVHFALVSEASANTGSRVTADLKETAITITF